MENCLIPREEQQSSFLELIFNNHFRNRPNCLYNYYYKVFGVWNLFIKFRQLWQACWCEGTTFQVLLHLTYVSNVSLDCFLRVVLSWCQEGQWRISWDGRKHTRHTAPVEAFVLEFNLVFLGSHSNTAVQNTMYLKQRSPQLVMQQ